MDWHNGGQLLRLIQEHAPFGEANTRFYLAGASNPKDPKPPKNMRRCARIACRRIWRQAIRNSFQIWRHAENGGTPNMAARIVNCMPPPSLVLRHRSQPLPRPIFRNRRPRSRRARLHFPLLLTLAMQTTGNERSASIPYCEIAARARSD